MAKLALTIAGGIIGGLLALPTGGLSVAMGFQIGALAGSLAGSLLFKQHMHTEGPRLQDRQIMSSSAGAFVPWGYGTVKMGGQLIWAARGKDGYIIKETKSTTEQSAKGGPTVSNTSYSYSATFAIAFGEGPGDVLRIWADTKMIYNRSGYWAQTWDISTTYNLDDVVVDGVKYFRCIHAVTGIEPTQPLFGQLYWATYTPPTSQAISKYAPPTFYRGTEDQLPDPTIQAAVGVSLTPAYRGEIYAVWEDFPLKNFGNRLPSISAEIAYATTTNSAYSKLQFPFAPPIHDVSVHSAPTMMIMDRKRNICFVGDGTGEIIQRVNTATGMVELTGFPQVSGDTGGAFTSFLYGGGNHGTPGGMRVDKDGFLWGVQLQIPTGGLAIYELWKYDPYTLAHVGGFVINPVYNASGDTPTAWSIFNDAEGNDYVAIFNEYISQSTYISIYRLRDGNLMGTGLLQTRVGGVGTPMPIGGSLIPIWDTKGNVWFVGSQDTGAGAQWHAWRVNSASSVKPGSVGQGGIVFGSATPPWSSAVYVVDQFDFTGDLYSAGPTHLSLAVGSVYDPADDSLIIFMSGTGDGGLKKFDCATQTIIATQGDADHPAFASGTGAHGFIAMAQAACDGMVSDGLLRVIQTQATPRADFIYTTYRASDLSLVSNLDPASFVGGSAGPNAGVFVIDYNTNSIVYSTPNGYETAANQPFIYYQLYLDRLHRQPGAVDAIVQDICNRCGVDNSFIDVASLSGKSVSGYPITAMSDGRRLIENLSQFLIFDGFESDFKLRFRLRGDSPSVTLPETELGLLKDAKALTENVTQEQDLPWRVIVHYSNQGANYDTGSQQKQRNARIVSKKNQRSVELPIVMNDADARQCAEKWLNIIRAERNTYDMNLWSKSRLVLDPTDPIYFVYEGITFPMRVTDVKIGQDLSLNISGVSEDFNNYLSQALPGNSDGFVDPGLNLVSPTLLWLLDIPLLQDTDNPPSGTTGIYFAEAPIAIGSWPAGVVFKSSDGAQYFDYGVSSTPTPYGTLLAPLAAPLSPMRWDFVNSISVNIPNANFTPASTTDLNLLNGANACLIKSSLAPGWELVQYRDAVQNADGSWTLSTLLRGRRGTEVAIGGSDAGSYILFLPTGINRNNEPTAIIGVQRYYKGVTPGQLAADVGAQTLTAEGNDLRPYAPCFIKGSLSGNDWTLGWLRRTRVGGDWLDLTGTVPLNETGQAYKVEITDSSGNVVRSTIVGSNRFSYPSADQTTDFGGNQTVLYVNLYQYSALAGKGFKATAIITRSETLPPLDTAAAMNPLPSDGSSSSSGGAAGDTFTVNGT